MKAADWKGTTSLSTIGLDVALSVLVGFFLGRWLDGKLGTAPWLALVGFAIGVGAAINAVMRGLREMKRAAAKEEAEEGNPRPLFGPGSLEDEAREAAAARAKAEAAKATAFGEAKGGLERDAEGGGAAHDAERDEGAAGEPPR